jgi:hypothetical protein
MRSSILLSIAKGKQNWIGNIVLVPTTIMFRFVLSLPTYVYMGGMLEASVFVLSTEYVRLMAVVSPVPFNPSVTKRC